MKTIIHWKRYHKEKGIERHSMKWRVLIYWALTMFIAKTAHSFIAVITVAFCYYGAKEAHLCCLEVHVLLLFILHLKSLPLVCDNIIISMETNQIVMKWNTYIKFGPFYLLSKQTYCTNHHCGYISYRPPCKDVRT